MILRALHIVTLNLFSVSVSTLLFLFTLETVNPGYVSHQFNLDILVYISLGSGLLSAFTYTPAGINTLASQITKWDREFLTVISLAVLFVVHHQLKLLGLFSIVIALLFSLMVFIVGYNHLQEN